MVGTRRGKSTEGGNLRVAGKRKPDSGGSREKTAKQAPFSTDCTETRDTKAWLVKALTSHYDTGATLTQLFVVNRKSGQKLQRHVLIPKDNIYVGKVRDGAHRTRRGGKDYWTRRRLIFAQGTGTNQQPINTHHARNGCIVEDCPALGFRLCLPLNLTPLCTFGIKTREEMCLRCAASSWIFCFEAQPARKF